MFFSSSECQTVHWRQGHKFECHPPSKTHQSDDVISDLRKKVAEQDYSGIHCEKSEIEGTEHKTSSGRFSVSDIGFSPEVSLGKDDDVRVESLAEANLTDSNSELSSNSFSGFSASPSSSDSSDDSSTCESVISNEHEKSEAHTFVVSALDIPDKTSGHNGMGEVMSSSPKFASLVDSVDDFSTMHKLNHITPGFSKEERKLASNVTSGLSMSKGTKIENSTVDSGFWDKTLDLRGIKANANDDTIDKTDPGSSFHFSFSGIPPLHVLGTKAKDSVPNDSFPNSVRNNLPLPGSVSSANDSVNSSKMRNLSVINSKESNVMSHNTPICSESNQLESQDSSGPPLPSFSSQSSSVGKNSVCADAFSIHNSQSAGSKVSNRVVENHGSTLKSTDIRSLTGEPDSNLASRTERHSHSSMKHGNNGIESGTSSKVANCSANSKSGLKMSVLKVVDQFRGSNLSKHFPLAVGNDIAGRYNDKVRLEQIFLCYYFWPRSTVTLLL